MVIWALLLFIAACIIADTARRYDEKKGDDKYSFCDFLQYSWVDSDARCGHLIATTVSYDHTGNHVIYFT